MPQHKLLLRCLSSDEKVIEKSIRGVSNEKCLKQTGDYYDGLDVNNDVVE